MVAEGRIVAKFGKKGVARGFLGYDNVLFLDLIFGCLTMFTVKIH